MTEYSFYSGDFTEWTTFFVYASDIFLVLALFFWLIFVLKNYSFKELLKNAVFVIPEEAGIQNLRQKTSYKKRILLILQTFLREKGKSDFTEENAKDEDDIHKYRLCLGKISKFLHDKFKKIIKLSKVWSFLLVFFAWAMLNLMVNNDYFGISVFQTFKLTELSLLVIFIYFNLKNSKTLRTSLFILVFSGFLQSLIAIYQFISQHSIFVSPILAKITGESVIGQQIPGVAKIVVDGEKIIRAYGTFSHPNVLGGFLIFTTLISIYLYLEHKKGTLSSIFDLDTRCPLGLGHRVSRIYQIFKFRNDKFELKTHTKTEQKLIYSRLLQIFKLVHIKIAKFLKLNPYNNTKTVKSQGVLYSLLWIILVFAQTSALFFTFSRTAWAGFLLSLFVISIFYFYNHKIVSRETIEKKYSSPDKERLGEVFENSQDYNLKLNNIVSRETISKIYNKIKNIVIKFKELAIVCLLLIFLIISNFSIIQARITDDLLNSNRLPSNSAISDRNFYNNVSRETISENYIFGSGLGTYIFQIDGFARNKGINQELQYWQYQPAHNIYFLIASEIGIVGLLFFLLVIMYVISNSIKDVLNVSRETFLNTRKINYFLLAIFVSFLFIGLFDHYFWTLQQGRLIFWFVLGMILLNSSSILEENRK